MDSKPVFTWLVFLSFNLPVIATLVFVPCAARLSEALKEKSPFGDSTGVTSYSRVVGTLGAVIVTAFFWAGGNIFLGMALTPGDFGHLAQLLNAFGRFLLFGSALFLPYAFNQLKTLFPGSIDSSGRSLLAQNTVAPTQIIGATSQITVVNLSSSIRDDQLQHALDAIGIQISQHFAPEWRCSANLSATRMDLGNGRAPVDGSTNAVIYLGDSSNSTNTRLVYAKGYHDQNLKEVPYGFVFLDVCALYNEPWSVTLSHEILEMLADPTAAVSVADPRDGEQTGLQYALEVCDPTQGDHYLINDVLVSNFVNRSFFCLPGGSSALNYRQLSQAPFTPRENGYIQYQDPAGASQQIWGNAVTDDQKAARVRLGILRRNGRRALRRSASA